MPRASPTGGGDAVIRQVPGDALSAEAPIHVVMEDAADDLGLLLDNLGPAVG